jgi:hypothetical protein
MANTPGTRLRATRTCRIWPQPSVGKYSPKTGSLSYEQRKKRPHCTIKLKSTPGRSPRQTSCIWVLDRISRHNHAAEVLERTCQPGRRQANSCFKLYSGCLPVDGNTNSAKTPITNLATSTPFQALKNGDRFALVNAHPGRNLGSAVRRCQ